MTRYFTVEFYEVNAGLVTNLSTGSCDHNAIVSSFEEMAALSQGRLAIVTGEVTQEMYEDEKTES
jgi:hypothetical protein